MNQHVKLITIGRELYPRRPQRIYWKARQAGIATHRRFGQWYIYPDEVEKLKARAGERG